MSNVEIAKGMYEAFANGNVPSVLGALTPDIEWTEAEGFPYGGTYHGQAEVLEGVFMRLGTEWERFTAIPEEFIDGGETVVTLGKYSGKYNSTGKSFVAHFAHVLRFRDGKIYKFQQYVDSHLVQEALKR